MIINKELGLNFNENPWQGSFIVDKLTDIVEEAVYKEFEAISERGGVLGAMDTMYQRGKIQEESLYYEHKKHDGSLPLVGVNTFLPKEHGGDIVTEIELIRSHRRREGPADRERRRLPAQPQRICGRRTEAATGHRPRTPQRVRKPDGSGEDAQPGSDQPCAVRRGRRVSAEYVTGISPCPCRSGIGMPMSVSRDQKPRHCGASHFLGSIALVGAACSRWR